MSSDELHQLLQTGIQAAQSGNKAIARSIFQQVIDLDPNNDLAWTWMATVVDTVSERRQCLEKALAINPANTRARDALEKLKTAPEPPIPQVVSERDTLLTARPGTEMDDFGESRGPRLRLPEISARGLLKTLIALTALGMIAAGLILLRSELEQQDQPTAIPTPTAQAMVPALPTASPIIVFVSETPAGSVSRTPRPQITPATWTPSPTWTASPVPPPTVTAPPPDAYTVLASAQPAGEAYWALFRLKADGSGLERLSFELPDSMAAQGLVLQEVFDADWSPDGTRIVFTGHITGASQDFEELFLAPAEGGSITRLTTLQADHTRGADWSPDGSRIVFASDADGDYELYLTAFEGENAGSPQRLTDNLVIDRDPAWSPTGTEIAFTSDRAAPGALAIWRMTLEDQSALQLTLNSHNSFAPSWSPDGQTILYLSDQNTVTDCYLMTAEGRGHRQLLINDVKAEERDPAWSPDGEWIVFSSNRESVAFELFVVRRDGSSLQRITFEEGTFRYPAWQP